jgi:hypothetical protein
MESYICLTLAKNTKLTFGCIHTECIKHQHTEIQKAYSYQTGEIDYNTTYQNVGKYKVRRAHFLRILHHCRFTGPWLS